MSCKVVFAVKLAIAHPALVSKQGIVTMFPLVSYPSPHVCEPLTAHRTNLTPRQVTDTWALIHMLIHRNVNLLIHTLKTNVL